MKKTTHPTKNASAPTANGKAPRKGGNWKVIDVKGKEPEEIVEIIKKAQAKPKAKPAKKPAPKKPSPKKATPPKDEPKAAKEPKAERGRPSIYTPELGELICRRIAAGETVRAIGRDADMPDESTIRGWALDNKDGFFPQYTRAVQIRAMGWSEEIIEISDDSSQDTYIDNNGNERTNNEVVARSRLRTDTRKWMLSKVLPKVYGDKLDVNHGVQPENPLTSMLQRIAGSGLPVIKDENAQ